jgi:hypothetical protein
LAVCICGGGNGVCRCLHGVLPVGGWVRVVKMQDLLFRAVRQWSALLLRWRGRLPHRLSRGFSASKGPSNQEGIR